MTAETMTMEKKTPEIYRHGDVLIHDYTSADKERETIIANSKRVEYNKDSILTLAEGEKTHHYHNVYATKGSAVTSYVQNDQVVAFEVADKCSFLKHNEHDYIIVKPGFYRVLLQRDYRPFELKYEHVVD